MMYSRTGGGPSLGRTPYSKIGPLELMVMRHSPVLERKLKEKLYEIVEKYYTPEELSTWVYEEYGRRVSPRNIKNFILRSREITARDLALLLLEKGYNPEKEWLDVLKQGSLMNLRQQRIPRPDKS